MSTIRSTLRSVPGLRKVYRKLRGAAQYPRTTSALEASYLYQQWWYYNIELLPGVTTKGQYEEGFPMLPRCILKNCRPEGMECLDLGSMEGLMPTLLAKRGAARVLASDAVDHCVDKMLAVQHYYKVKFDYQKVGLMYDLASKISGSFDLVNCSGLLYHVVSPFLVLAGVRPLLKRNGIMVVSTNVVFSDEMSMDFNDKGRLQDETNTFWYLSIPLLDYILRYLRLVPIDCLYLPHENISSHIRYLTNRKTGYMSVACRAADEPLPANDDGWMLKSAKESWEYQGLVDWKRAEANALSTIGYRVPGKNSVQTSPNYVDLWRAVNERPPMKMTSVSADTHTLHLQDRD